MIRRRTCSDLLRFITPKRGELGHSHSWPRYGKTRRHRRRGHRPSLRRSADGMTSSGESSANSSSRSRSTNRHSVLCRVVFSEGLPIGWRRGWSPTCSSVSGLPTGGSGIRRYRASARTSERRTFGESARWPGANVCLTHTSHSRSNRMTRQRFGPSMAADTTLSGATSETHYTRFRRSR